ncbi:TPA: TniB family NTP-binding protein [Acinetobacter baumannii]|uniref:Bacterial TniB protein n=2 Tax=Acinetobacter haemolyticus TaxID=29430 RepID=D4XLK2_ACIHA|nr:MULTISPECIES: TniB family NTP-binding protein [Acinetobacter]EFF83934.1 bacterial TniB protein [Acinetobacter haemolyticus ATCC 19194]EIB6895596.1 TniB family NTP-binding protein [Acinetobacter baumannii]EKV0482883.1 TniB family NTP-binding protein [Acinetobacter baumannii]EKV0866751.1 TniB family NTP-binding protein [Acinetobacter baumannii]EKW6896573.1 TniB family NTP-binding protein [Acinetobacter baumannii]
MSNYPHIFQEFRPIVDQSNEDRLYFLEEDRWIGYPAANDLLDQLKGMLTLPKRSRMPNLLVLSKPNNGKTSIINQFFKLYGEGYINELNNAVKPVIVVQAPVSPDEKALYMAILDRFWEPFRERDPVAKLRYQVVHCLKLYEVKLLIIDEMNSLLCGTPIKQRTVMNAIKYLCNETHIPVVGFGTEEAVRVLYTDPQHVSRFRVVNLPLWQLDKEFQALVNKFEKVLPLKQPSRLAEPATVKYLHDITEGNLGNLRSLLREAAKKAIISGQEYIDHHLLEDVR